MSMSQGYKQDSNNKCVSNRRRQDIVNSQSDLFMMGSNDTDLRATSDSLRLLLGYESDACNYSDSVLYCIIHVLEEAFLHHDMEETDTAFAVALRCCPKLFQDLALTDHMKILPRIVNIVKQRVAVGHVMKKVRICEMLIELICSSKLQQKYENWTSLIAGKLVLEKVDIFTSMKEFLDQKEKDDDTANQRAKVCIDLMMHLIKEGKSYKAYFIKTFHGDSLTMFLRRLNNISYEVVESLFKLLVNGNWIHDGFCNVIANGEIANVLIQLLPHFSPEFQRYVCETLRVMCATVAHNRIMACQYDVISSIIKLLDDAGQLPIHILSCLISLLEILGSLSIKPHHLKQLIGLFKSKDETSQISYSDRLLQALERMASQVDRRQPSYFLDFYDPTDIFVLTAPSIHKWNGKGITFHAWLCLDFSLPTPTQHRKPNSKVRHMLYSFLNSTGEGFEAFFTEKGYLVIGVCTKKEYFAAAITEVPFSDQEWHSLAIIYTKRSFGRSFVTVYVDGQLFHQSTIKYPVTDVYILSRNLGVVDHPTEGTNAIAILDLASPNLALDIVNLCRQRDAALMDLVYSTIGYGVRFNPNFCYNLHPPPAPTKSSKSADFPDCIAAGQQNDVWGEVYMLKGQISSLQLFNDSLSQSTLSELFLAGPNNWNHAGFSYTVDAQGKFHEISKQLVLHFDAKAAYDNICVDLSPNVAYKSKYSQNLTARICCAWDIKSSIQCIGGLQVLFPLLEQVKFTESSPEKLHRDVCLPPVRACGTVSTRDLSVINSAENAKTDNDEPITFNHIGHTASEEDMGSNEAVDGEIASEIFEQKPKKYFIEQSLTTDNGELGDSIQDTKVENVVMKKPVGGETKVKAAGSFLVIESPQQATIEPSRKPAVEDWVLVDRSTVRTRNMTFSKWAADEDNYILNGASYFISLLRNMLIEQTSAQEFFLQSKGVQIMGLILQKCDPRLINVGLLMSLQALVESIAQSKDELLKSVYQHIMFDFRIWTDSDISVRIAHVQLLSTYIKDDPEYFSQSFGVGFIVQVINAHYSGKTRAQVRENSVELNDSDSKCVRMALLGTASFYLKSRCSEVDISAIVSYLSALTDLELLTEAIEIIKHMMETPGDNKAKLFQMLSESDLPYVFIRWLVHDNTEKTRIDIIKIFHILISSTKVPTAAKSRILMKTIGYESVCTLLSKQMVSRSIIIAILKLALSTEQTAAKGVDIYVHYEIVNAVLSIVKMMSSPIKLEIALKIRNSMKCHPTSTKKCVLLPGWYEPFLQLIMMQAGDDNEFKIDQMQEELVEVVLEIIHFVMWKGIDGSDATVWRERGQPLAALHQMAARNQFILPVLVIERRLLTKCIKACSAALNESVQPWAVDTLNAVQVVKLVEDFLLSTEFSETPEEVWIKKWNIDTLDSLHDLLNAMNAWEDSTEAGSEWTEVLRTAERILYECAIADDIAFVSYAAKKLHQMLSRRKITNADEACYEINRLNSVYNVLLEKGNNIHTIFSPVFRLCFERFHDMLRVDHYLKDMPSLNPATHEFEEKFGQYFYSEQYRAFANKMVRVAKRFNDTHWKSNSIDIGRFWMDCLSSMAAAVKIRGHNIEESLQSFSRFIYFSFEEIRNTAQILQNKTEAFLKHNLSLTNRLWQDRKKFLTSERGAWVERKEEKQLWKLSSTENSSRMRLKLVKLFNGTDHQDASRLRDQDTLEVVTSNEIMDLNIPTAKEEEDSIQDLVLSGEEDQDEVDAETGQEKHMYDLNPLNESVGRVITSCNCHLITLMDVIPGKIELTSSHISFYDDSNDSLVGCDFQFSLEKLQEMHMRRYNLRKTGLEFFLVDRSSYLINFRDHEERNTFFKKTTGRRPPNLYYNGIKSPQRLLRESNLTQRWVKREITNFDYLMQLNTIAGRTYNDLAQYPVFPWVLADYESKELDLENPAVFRDLSRPIGALVADRLEALEIRYRELFDPSGFQHQCHYLTHYSNAAIVLHYLLRVEPFTSLHVKLQGGKFDCSDRQFYSVAKSWRGLINSAGDVRELIPEFFCFPDFLSNVNKLDLGYLQNGQSIDDVVLPPWASSPDDFIHKNRMALESEYVSMNLHHWIDLIFGYKQKGEEAVKAYNVFHHYSYEGAIDLDAIDNPKERTAIEGIINNFGQTPCQLLTKPHPIRKSISEIKQQTNILDNLTKANYSLVKVNANGPPLTFIGARKTRQKSLLHHGMPDPLITVDKNGFIGFHGWMPFPEDKTESFSFSLDPNLNQKMNRTKNPTNKIPGIWSPQVSRTSQLFALTPDGKLLICCGFWDNSLRVLNSKGKILNVIYQHLDIVSCVSLDPSDHYFISGSYDSSCMVWKIQHHAGSATGILEQPLQTLHGHDDAVNTVAMVWELDMAVSGSKDGSCIIHTIKKGQFVMTLRPDPLLLDSSISKVCLTKYGRIVMYSTHNYKDETDHMLTVYTINGTLVSKVSLHEAILDVIVVKDIIISGGIRGTLTARDVYRLESPLIAKNLQYPIHCISVTPDASHIFACIEDGNIIVLGP